MYSRLYTHILNHFPQIDHCASFHHIYNDSSLFGLFASFVPSSNSFVPSSSTFVPSGNTPQQILPHLVHQLSLLLYKAVPGEELGRARNQLKSSLMMALESRQVEVEDLGRQVRFLIPLILLLPYSLPRRLPVANVADGHAQILVHNRKVPMSEMVAHIDNVSADSIRRVAERVFGHKATVVGMGREETGDWQGVLKKYGVGAAA